MKSFALGAICATTLGTAVGKLFPSARAKNNQSPSTEKLENDFDKLKDRISDLLRELCAHSELFCLEASKLLTGWVNEHIDDYINEHPDKIIALGEPRISALKSEINRLKVNMPKTVAYALLSGHEGICLDDIEIRIKSADDELEIEPHPARAARSGWNVAQTTKLINARLLEIAGRLGDIMASYGLINDNHQRWKKQKDSDNYQYVGTILWTETMSSLLADYMALKREYREQISRIPQLKAERLRLEARHIWER